MERELWNKTYHLVIEIASNKRPRCTSFSDAQIALTYFWSVLNNRPIYWACRKSNWPLHMRRCRIPTASTMTRRLRSASIQRLFKVIEQHLTKKHARSTCRWIDAKPLPIGGCSKDKQSAYGRASAAIAKGYKFYAIADRLQGFISWVLKPMNHNEATVAPELIDRIEEGGYLIGDSAYDKNHIFDYAAQFDIQLIAPRRIEGKALGHRRHSPFRLRSLELTERPFGKNLLSSRTGIERMFGNLTTFTGGLGPLPHWVRTLFRVEQWVRAKLIFYHIWMALRHVAKSA